MKVELYDLDTGERWPTQRACAEALGVPKSAIAYAVGRGKPINGRRIVRDYYGVIRKKQLVYDKKEGVFYDSVDAAAAAAGVSRSTVAQHIGEYQRWGWRDVQ